MGIRHSTVTVSNMSGRNQFMWALRRMLSAVFLASMLLWMPGTASAAAAAPNSAARTPDAVAERTVVSATSADFQSRDADLFNQGWRLTVLQNTIVGGQLRYTAVWKPGTGGQL